MLRASIRRIHPNTRISHLRAFYSQDVKQESTKQEKYPPPAPLDRPLGVLDYPTTKVKTKLELINEMMDHDVRMAQRRHLIKEAATGYWADMNATRRHGGKTFIAPPVMIREDKALYFPNVSGKTLDTNEKQDTAIMCAGRISIVGMLSTRMSEVQIKGFVDPTLSRYSSHPSFQYVQINLQENILKSWVVNMFTNSLRKTIAPNLQHSYLISNQNMEYYRDPMGMVNARLGYVYLVDEQLRIRWAACADPTKEETEALVKCTGVLLNRLDRRLGTKQSTSTTTTTTTSSS